MLAPAPTAPSSRARRAARADPEPTRAPDVGRDARLASRHHAGPATVEELVARDIGAFSLRRRP
jgi:hypothetical protein